MQKHYLEDVIEPTIKNLGFEIVRVLTIVDKNHVIQIMIEHKDYNKEITVDDCATVSKALSVLLDEKDPIDDKYVLEVSSPGLDRPLTKLEHFSRYIGYVIKLETLEMVEKRKRFKGVLKEVNGNNVVINMEETDYTIAYDNISKAKIVLTDELWEQYLKAHKNNQN